MVVRPLAASDSIPELTALLNRAYRPLLEQGMRYVASHQDDEITRERIVRGECFVAELGGRLVGTIVFEDAMKTTGCGYYDRPGVSSFHQFAVAPEIQGRGIGRLLLERVEARARETGATELALDTSEKAAHLIATYGRHGYHVVDVTEWRAVNYRSVIMSKRLLPA